MIKSTVRTVNSVLRYPRRLPGSSHSAHLRLNIHITQMDLTFAEVKRQLRRVLSHYVLLRIRHFLLMGIDSFHLVICVQNRLRSHLLLHSRSTNPFARTLDGNTFEWNIQMPINDTWIKCLCCGYSLDLLELLILSLLIAKLLTSGLILGGLLNFHLKILVTSGPNTLNQTCRPLLSLSLRFILKYHDILRMRNIYLHLR